MLTLKGGGRIMPTRRSVGLMSMSQAAVKKLKTDLRFWHLFQVHWLHALHKRRLGPDLGGWALYGYPPCTRQQAAYNLMVYSDYRFRLIDTKTQRRLPITEGLLRFTKNPLQILPGGKPGIWSGSEFYDFRVLGKLKHLTPEETFALFVATVEEQ